MQHALHDVIRVIDRSAFTVQYQAIAVDAQRDRKRVFEGGEILVELSKKAEMIAQRTQIDGSFCCRLQ
jgi:hypothetical protein